MRHVICHYHIYKNSGTTFDGILSDNFGERHICFDGPFPYFSINQVELGKVIRRNPAAIAFSSHQTQLPVPCSLDFNVIPVVFVRHPLLRIYSIYKFKQSENDGTETSRNAVAMDFDEWVRHSLSHSQEITQVSNAQTRILSGLTLARRTPAAMIYDVYQARRNLQAVELLARTEHFQQDVAEFPGKLERYGLVLSLGDMTPRNVTASDFEKSVDERLQEVAQHLKPETFNMLELANSQDLLLYGEVSGRLDGSC